MVCGEPNVHIYIHDRLYSTTILRNSIIILLRYYIHGYKKRIVQIFICSFSNRRGEQLDDEIAKGSDDFSY